MNLYATRILPLAAVLLFACAEDGTVVAPVTSSEAEARPQLVVDAATDGADEARQVGGRFADFVRAKHDEYHVQAGLQLQDGVFDTFADLDWIEPPRVDRQRRTVDIDLGGEATSAFAEGDKQGDPVPGSRRCIDEDSYLCWSIICWECDSRGWAEMIEYCEDDDLDEWPNTNVRIQVPSHVYYCGFLNADWGDARQGCLFDDYAAPNPEVAYYDSLSEWGTCLKDHDCNDSASGNGYGINPGQPITPYDGIDQDCSGDDACFVDFDKDLHASSGDGPAGEVAAVSMVPGTRNGCDPGSGYLTSGYPRDDCDDGNPNRFAGYPEVCDGVDNDCDGEIDEGLGNWGFCDPSSDNAQCGNGYVLCSPFGGSSSCSRGAIAAYTFDGGGGPTAYDGTNNDVDLTLAGARHSDGESISNSSLYFDGTSDSAYNLDVTRWLNAPAMTLSIWVYPERSELDAPYEQYVAVSDHGTSTWRMLLRRHPDGKVRWYLSSAGTSVWIESDAAIQTDRWTHIAVTAEQFDLMRMYVDGVEQADTASLGQIDFGGSHYLGAHSNPGFTDAHPFQGYLDELLILPVQLPQEIIDDFYAGGAIPERHLVREFCDGRDNDCQLGVDDPFGNLDGDLADDPNDLDTCLDSVFSCGVDRLTGGFRELGPRVFYDMDTINAPDGAAEVKNVAGRYAGVDAHGDRIGGSYVDGRKGDAFEGVNAFTYIEVPHSDAIDIDGDEITMTAWIQPQSFGGESVILGKEDAYMIGLNYEGRFQCAVTTDDAWTWVTGPLIPNDGSWHHVACRYRSVSVDEGIIELVVDGVLQPETGVQRGWVASSPVPLTIGGRQSGPGSPFVGRIDDVGIWANALDDAQIGTVMTDGAAAVLLPGADIGENLEICDGNDNNCNGDVDETFVVAQLGPYGDIDYRAVGDPCDGADSDFCDDEGGFVVCTDNRWEAECTDDSDEDDLEVCDNLDNDCNETVDDGFDVGDACSTGDSDICADGLLVCSGGAAICSGGAMAIYNFEREGEPMVDLSGNGTAAVLTDGTVVTTNTRSGIRSLSLAGNETSSVRIPNAVATRTDEFTIAAWVRPATSGIQGAIFSAADSFGNNPLLLGTEDWLFVNGTPYSLPLNLPDGVWSHVAVTYGRGLFRVYVNGGRIFSEPIATSPLASITSDIFVGQNLDSGSVRPGCPDGCSTSASTAYAGQIDDLVWYGHALSDGGVVNLAIEVPGSDQNLERCDFRDNDCDDTIDPTFATGDECDGPDADECDTDAKQMCAWGGGEIECGWGAAALLDFETEILPGRVLDLSGSGEYGFLGIGAQLVSDGGDQVVEFDGSLNGRVSFNAPHAWRDTFTIGFRARAADTSTVDQALVSRFTRRVDTMRYLGVSCPTGRAFEIARDGYIYINCSRIRVEGIRDALRAPGNPWVHIAVVHDGSSLKVFVDGVRQTMLVEQQPGTWVSVQQLGTERYGSLEWNSQIWLGQSQTRPNSGFIISRAFEGWMDDFAWFDYPLTDGEVAALTSGFPADSINEEICDLVDNDCDDDVNEDLVRSCDTACGSGVEYCDATGNWSGCSARDSEDEQCDPVDHDCDGDNYNGFPYGEVCRVGLGECETDGYYECNASLDGVVCVGTPLPRESDERCDELDHDCDGDPLNGFPVGEECIVGLGVCAAEGTWACNDDEDGVVCVGTPGVGESVERCDDIDRDCDGDPYTSADPSGPDYPSGPCTRGIGACEGTGEWVCVTETEAVCNAVELEGEDYDICNNGIDDDCNGEVDETTISGLVTVVDVAVGDPSFDFSMSGPCDIRQGDSPCAAITFTVQNTSPLPIEAATTGVRSYSLSGSGVRNYQSPATALPRDVPAGSSDTFVFCWENLVEREDVSVGVELVGACVAGDGVSDDDDYDLGLCGSEICDGFDNDGDGDIDELPDACGGRATEVCVNDPDLGGYYCVEALQGESCHVTGCPVGQTCADDECVPGCVHDRQCGGTAICVDGTCVQRRDVDDAADLGGGDDSAGAADRDDDPGRSGCATAPGRGLSLLGLVLVGLVLRPRRRQ